jgi:hypothetical protein
MAYKIEISDTLSLNTPETIRARLRLPRPEGRREAPVFAVDGLDLGVIIRALGAHATACDRLAAGRSMGGVRNVDARASLRVEAGRARLIADTLGGQR